jgi:uncharacterized membrane protein YhhN
LARFQGKHLFVAPYKAADTPIATASLSQGVTMATLLIVSALCFASAYFILFCGKTTSWPRTIVKTLSIALLAFATLMMGGPNLLVIGLILSAIGDYCLSRDGDNIFILGVGAFAAAHVAYIVLFLNFIGSDPSLIIGDRILATIALVMLGGIMLPTLWKRAGQLRVPVVIYVPIIIIMGLSALTLPMLTPIGFALLGAFLFMASDFILSLELFVLNEKDRVKWRTSHLVWITYWPAQILIFWAMVA